MLGGKNKQPHQLGYTIVEVMIVLAVSGLLFVIAANFIGQKQANTAFRQGVSDMTTAVQGVIAQVQDGQYSDIPISCKAFADHLQITAGVVGQAQGNNDDCTFLGKLMEFAPRSQTAAWALADDSSHYQVFSIAASRPNLKTPNPDTPFALLSDANPTPVIATDSSGIDFTTNQIISQNLSVIGIQVQKDTGDYSAAADHYYGLGFIQSLGASAGGSYQSGYNQIHMVYIDSSTDQTEASTAGMIKAASPGLQYAGQAKICLSDGPLNGAGNPTGSRFASIFIGKNQGELSVTSKVENDNACTSGTI